MDVKKMETMKYIQTNISKLSQTEIDEIFKILYKNKSTYTQNNNGIFVNLSWLDEEILNQIYTYINFCLTSQTEINKYEIMKNIMTDSLVSKERPDDKIVQSANSSNVMNLQVTKQSKVSSSMKFYLLKKKYLKKNSLHTNINNNLTHEEYVI